MIRCGEFTYTKEIVQVLLRNYPYFRSKAEYRMDEELIVLLADIEVAMTSVKFTQRQKQALYYYMMGYTLEDIGVELGITHPAVVGLIERATEKLSLYLEGALMG